MLRTVACAVKNISRRYYATAPKTVSEPISRGLPIITCKRTEFNCFSNDDINVNVKFGEIPLASSGWRHHKSKGDHFNINAILPERETEALPMDRNELLQFGVTEQLVDNMKEQLEIQSLTSIQSQALPLVSDMNHVLIAAETGCGKTLAYLLPIVAQILKTKSKVQEREFNTPFALIITPGRELAEQVATVAENLTKGLGLQVKSIVGGHTKRKMLNPEFEEVDILVGTMGALSKLVTTGIYRMNACRHVVLDEADTLLDDSFSGKLCHFLKRFPFHKNHLTDLSNQIIGTQLILASATMPTNMTDLLQQIVDTETIREIVSPNLHRLMPHITQKFLRMNKSDRPGLLLTLVKGELRKRRPLIIFSNKSATSDFVSIFLENQGVNNVNLNGDMLMAIRIGKFEQFQNGDADVLSTTDVGSRGLDTTRARHVINFDFPLHVADYIHRSGRIGRVGSHQRCLVTNFVSSQREIDVVQRIEHAARTGGILPNVNANITGIIKKRIIREMQSQGLEAL